MVIFLGALFALLTSWRLGLILLFSVAIDFVTTSGLRARMFADLDVGCYLAWRVFLFPHALE